MSYVSIIPFVLIISLILVIVTGMAIAILSNYRTGLRFRDELTRRIKYLRLDKMLSKRNITREHFLHIGSISNIENQIRSCESCSITEQCDQALKESSSTDLSFCPNDEDLESIANKSKSLTK